MLVFKCFLVFENQAKSLRAMTARVRADGQAFKKAHRAKRVNIYAFVFNKVSCHFYLSVSVTILP